MTTGRPPVQQQAVLAAIEAAGPEGISPAALASQLGVRSAQVRMAVLHARDNGATVFTLARGFVGGIYFARREWLEVAQAAWAAHLEAARRERDKRNTQRRCERRRAATAAKRAAQPPKPPKQPKVAKPRKPKAEPKPKAAKLHALGAVIPKVVGRDGKPVPAHNQTAKRTLQPVVRVVDESRAVRTVYTTPPGRFEVVGPVHRAIDSRECRPWAVAAAGGGR